MKGKISRTLANKCALCCRFDALGEDQDGKLGADSKTFMEKRLKLLESGGQVVKAFSGAANGQKKWEAKAQSKGYSNGGDFVGDGAPSKRQKF